MAINAKVIVVGDKKFVAETSAENSARKSPQDHVQKTDPVKRVAPPRVEHEPPQDVADNLGEPKMAGSKNSFILRSSSKFHRDMIEE